MCKIEPQKISSGSCHFKDSQSNPTSAKLDDFSNVVTSTAKIVPVKSNLENQVTSSGYKLQLDVEYSLQHVHKRNKYSAPLVLT